MGCIICILLSLVIGGFVVSFGLAIMLGVVDLSIDHKFKPIVNMQERRLETFGLMGSGLIFVLMGLASTVFIMRLPVPKPPGSQEKRGDYLYRASHDDGEASGD